VVVWEGLSKSEQEQWSKKMAESKDWVVWCRSRKKDEEQRPLFEADVKLKSSQTSASKQKPKQENRWIRKKATGSLYARKRGGDRATSNAL